VVAARAGRYLAQGRRERQWVLAPLVEIRRGTLAGPGS
jgi:hypothetical protein